MHENLATFPLYFPFVKIQHVQCYIPTSFNCCDSSFYGVSEIDEANKFSRVHMNREYNLYQINLWKKKCKLKENSSFLEISNPPFFLKWRGQLHPPPLFGETISLNSSFRENVVKNSALTTPKTQ